MMDKSLVLRKLTELDLLREQLGEYRNESEETYQSDWKTQRIVERTLQLMIEVCADIANHIIAEKQLTVPTGYAHAFEVLGQAGLLSRELTAMMANVAKFRNILVHQYTRIDAAIVISILHQRLDDFVSFRNEIVKLLK